MATPAGPSEFRRLTTPRSAAIAGVLFAVLFAGSLVLLRVAIPGESARGTDWLEEGTPALSAAVTIMPFAGISFLWFIGVIRDRLGDAEDRFFASVFFGSGLLFLAMIFISMAVAGGILASARTSPDPASTEEIAYFGRAVMLQISNGYALRMAGVFMISLGTIWLRTGSMPKWLAIITYVAATTLLVISTLSLWATLVFPAWVLLVSLHILLRTFGRRAPHPPVDRAEDAGGPPPVS
ncbi:hypothetical protein IWX63_002708 [Arthrobacter sp. CAN_A2]|uniref:hypothetical protein n=1 Tax=Arthrobacter sp. CAN_A2 TaxID=2787718 RepID=UPI0018EF6A87